MAKNAKTNPAKKDVESKKDVKVNDKPEVIENNVDVNSEHINDDTKAASPAINGVLIGGDDQTVNVDIDENKDIDESLVIQSAKLETEVENVTTEAPAIDGVLIGGDDVAIIPDEEEDILENDEEIEELTESDISEKEPENDEEEIYEDFDEKPEINISNLNPNQMRFYIRTGMLPK